MQHIIIKQPRNSARQLRGVYVYFSTLYALFYSVFGALSPTELAHIFNHCFRCNDSVYLQCTIDALGLEHGPGTLRFDSVRCDLKLHRANYFHRTARKYHAAYL